jgi:serine/threonine-protein kinase/endoribonuclease IRE1
MMTSNTEISLFRVAVFDVLKSPGKQQPFVLLQPNPRLQDVLTGSLTSLPNIDSAYVGLVKETGSLFAMTPDHFPLVMFGDTNSDHEDTRLIGGPSVGRSPETDRYTYEDLNSNPQTKRPGRICGNGSPDRRCLTGVRRLGDDSRSRISGQLDGPPSVALPPLNHDDPPIVPGAYSWGNNSIFPPWSLGNDGSSASGQNMTLGLSQSSVSFFAALTLILLWVLLLPQFLLIKFRTRRSGPPLSPPTLTNIEEKETPTIASPADQSLSIPLPEEISAAEPSTALPNGIISTQVSSPLPTATSGFDSLENGFADIVHEVNGGEDSGHDGDASPAPGKRKNRRGNRGKRKKVTSAVGEEGECEHESEKVADVVQDPVEVESPAIGPDHPPSLVTSSTPNSTLVKPSLVVSDTILGESELYECLTLLSY